MDVKEIVKDIKSQFRLYMNGPVSQNMRESGLDYRVNYGIDLPRLNELASGYEKNHEVAQELWKDNIRESKILAGLLQPVDSFYPEIADIWVESMHTPEIVQITCMNLFQHLPYARDKSFQWMADEREYIQLCGFTLMARLLMNGEKLSEKDEDEFLDQAFSAVEGTELLLRQAAVNALRKYIAQSRENRKKLGRMLNSYLSSSKVELKNIASDLKSEIDSFL